MTIKILTTIAVLFTLTACQNAQENQAEHDAKVAADARAELLIELEAAANTEARQKKEEIEETNTLAPMGVVVYDGKLIIDTNQTKTFFQEMAATMKAKADQFAKDLEEGNINNPQAGIEMNQTNINIDLNKTKSFFENWEKTVEGYVKQFEAMTKQLNNENLGK
jgi:hypothetical protein